MLQVTKIFRFEMAHAIHGYEGACRHLHGHSYELQVTVKQSGNGSGFIAPPGFVLDFKVLKGLVHTHVVSLLDHQLVLSKAYLQRHPFLKNAPNLFEWNWEPTAENLLVFVQQQLMPHLPPQVKLASLKLYETADSFAEWIDDASPQNRS